MGCRSRACGSPRILAACRRSLGWLIAGFAALSIASPVVAAPQTPSATWSLPTTLSTAPAQPEATAANAVLEQRRDSQHDAPSPRGVGQQAPGRDDAPRRLQVLFLGAPTRNGPHHDPITRYRTLKQALGVAGIDLTYHEDPRSAFTAAGLSPFDAVLLYGNWDQHGVLPVAQRQALLEWVQAGGGFVPVHCASACWGRSPEFVRLVGARFLRHGGEEFTVDDVLPEHPILTGREPFHAFDETYEHDEQAADRVILQRRGDEPWTWVRSEGRGRVFYTAAGHDHRVWDQPQFQRLLQNGILWAVGDEKRALLQALALPELVEEEVSLPGYRHRREITRAQRPLSPADSQKLAQVPPGMQLQLFASESDIVNPIAIAFDHRGRAFVIETVDYPNNLQQGDLGHDRITICVDTDGDGRADRFTRFAEGLSIPTSLTFANGGVLCTNGSEVLFLADTDGDDRADRREVLFRGFHMGDTHAGVSNLRYGIDGWIWATIGYSGFHGEVGGKSHDFAQGVFRFRPDGSELEFVQHTTNNTWGLGLTAAGDVVGSTANGNPSWFMTFPDAVYRRAGLEPHPTPRADDDPLFFPSSRDIRQVDFFDRYTSAAGHSMYTARRFGEGFDDHTALVCEPTGKLVGLFQLERRGGGFRAVHSPNPLFSSADAWSSPVCAEVGPDGAVWICDWYNLIVQHNPTPTRSSAGIDARTGRGNAYETPLRDVRHGRIWRVFPRGSIDDPMPKLADGDVAAALAALSHDNMLWRLHAQRLLLAAVADDAEADDVVLPELKRLVDAAGVASPHALWVLAGMRSLPDELLATALRSPHEAPRRAALQLANVSLLRQQFVVDGEVLGAPGRELAELLVRLAEAAADPAIGAAILRTGVVHEAAIFADITLRDAWQIAARRHASTVVAAADAAGLARAEASQPVNLLQNASFGAADGARPTGWTDLRFYGGPGRDSVEAVRVDTGRGDTSSLRISASRTIDCGIATVVAVKAGVRYRLSGHIRTDSLQPVRGGPGALLNVHGGVRTRGVAGTRDWTEVAVEFDAEEDGEITVHCLFGGYGGATGTAWFDDVALVAVGSGNTLRGALDGIAALAAGNDANAAAEPKTRRFAIDEAFHQRGAAVYARTCIACHGFDGNGAPPGFPPLDRSEWLLDSPERAIDIVLHGLTGPVMVGATRFDGTMPPLGSTLGDDEIAAALTYARQSWHNDAAPITAELVAARRALHRARTAMWTAAELVR